jgi:hypothetical protein
VKWISCGASDSAVRVQILARAQKQENFIFETKLMRILAVAPIPTIQFPPYPQNPYKKRKSSHQAEAVEEDEPLVNRY